MSEDKTLTGIQGFDEICYGGLVSGRAYLLSGTSGAGKTIFSLQYLYNGATRFGENGIFLATEESPRQIREDALKFGWDLQKLEDEHKLAIIDGSSAKIGIPSTEKVVSDKPFDMNYVIDQLISIQQELDAKRAVIDSSTSIAYNIPDKNKGRVELLRLGTTLKILELTTIITCELEHNPDVVTMENFVVDGVVVLYFRHILDTRIHSVEIYKMRGSEHSNKIHPFKITSQGIVVNANEGVYGEF